MEEHIVKILHAEFVTHNVRRFQIEKPEGYQFTPGQATEVAINKPKWKDERRPFTFTSLNSDPYLEFTIKIYSDHKGVTNELGKLVRGDELIIHDVWGAINYQGPGVFLAGGAGVTPFIAIFRQLYKDKKIAGNRLIFSNKTEEDIILKEEFENMLGDQFYNTITQGKTGQYDHHLIDEGFIKTHIKDFEQHFYVCGPEKFQSSIQNILQSLGAKPDSVVFEK